MAIIPSPQGTDSGSRVLRPVLLVLQTDCAMDRNLCVRQYLLLLNTISEFFNSQLKEERATETGEIRKVCEGADWMYIETWFSCLIST